MTVSVCVRVVYSCCTAASAARLFTRSVWSRISCRRRIRPTAGVVSCVSTVVSATDRTMYVCVSQSACVCLSVLLFNSTIRLISGTLHSAPLSWLPVLSNVEPPALWRKAATDKLVEKIVTRQLANSAWYPQPTIATIDIHLVSWMSVVAMVGWGYQAGLANCRV